MLPTGLWARKCGQTRGFTALCPVPSRILRHALRLRLRGPRVSQDVPDKLLGPRHHLHRVTVTPGQGLSEGPGPVG